VIAATDLGKIGELIGVAAVAGVLVAVVFSLCLTGFVHAGEARRDGRGGAVVGWGALAGVGLLAFLGLCALGIVFITAT
jgi:hypothetical protein